MKTITTPTTEGWLSDDSIILPGWNVTLVGPSRYPPYTRAVKDGRPCVSQELTKPPSTTGTRQGHDPRQKFLTMVAEQRLSVTVRCVSRLFKCGCCRASVAVRNTAETVAKDERTAAEPETLKYRCFTSRNRLLKWSRRSCRRSTLRSSRMTTSMR